MLFVSSLASVLLLLLCSSGNYSVKCLDGDPTTPFLIYPEGYMNDSKAGITWMTQPNLTTNLVWTLASLNHICRSFPLLLILRAENSLGLLFLWIGSLAWWALFLRVPFLLFYFGIKPLFNLTSFSENLDFNFNFLGILFPVNLCVSYCFYATCLFLLVWGILLNKEASLFQQIQINTCLNKRLEINAESDFYFKQEA